MASDLERYADDVLSREIAEHDRRRSNTLMFLGYGDDEPSENSVLIAECLMYSEGTDTAVDTASDWIEELVFGDEQTREARADAVRAAVRERREIDARIQGVKR